MRSERTNAMTVFPCQWTIVCLLKSHRYLPFSTMCPSLKAHGGIKWTGLKTMLGTHGVDATWLWYRKCPHTMTSYINRCWRDSSALSHLSSFRRAAWGKSWASLSPAANKACAQSLSWSEEVAITSWREWLLSPACVGAPSSKCVACPCPRTAFGF